MLTDRTREEDACLSVCFSVCLSVCLTAPLTDRLTHQSRGASVSVQLGRSPWPCGNLRLLPIKPEPLLLL